MTGQLIAISHSSVRAITKSVLPEIDEVSSDAYLHLIVSISAENIVARDFAAFLEFIDRIYGRSHKDFRSYSRRQTGHFKFAKCQQGSWELIAREALGVATNSSPLVIMWLVLKYLPSAVLSVSSAYNQYEQGRLARANRQRIREELGRSGGLEDLTSKQRAEVARMIERVSQQEVTLIPRVRRFMASSFIGVRISIDKIRNRGD
ncbi:hypothetical protein [Rhodanobacter thiooxydans]|uniref:hypothetical protein n=1 Tax=Rhodanobacter thiooxydans TaxID=416169 RepID=UPI00131F1151|nr:hypothetical protein [Rhodanobacter thiooxydans]